MALQKKRSDKDLLEALVKLDDDEKIETESGSWLEGFVEDMVKKAKAGDFELTPKQRVKVEEVLDE